MSSSKSSESSTPTPTLSSQCSHTGDTSDSRESIKLDLPGQTQSVDLEPYETDGETPITSKHATPDEMSIDEPDLIQLCEDCKVGNVQAMKRTLSQTSGLTNAIVSHEIAGRLISAILSHDEGKRHEILSLLLEYGLRSPSVIDQDGNTLLHTAASRGNLDIASKILSHESQSNDKSASVPNLLRQMNRSGYTPFGMATSETNYLVAMEILSYASGDPTGTIPDFKKHFFPKFRTYPLDKPVKVYVLGDMMAGKSTLIQLLQDKKSIPPFELVSRLVGRQARNVGTHFGGLITNDFYEVGSKRVIFCDLAGSINFFSEELLEPADKLECVIFVIVIRLGTTKENISERLTYWLSFLHFYTGISADMSSESSIKPNVVVIATYSHKDKGSIDQSQLTNVYSQARFETTCNFLTDELEKPFVLDCTRIKSTQANELRNAMKGFYEIAHRPFQDQPSPSSICYILSEVLYDSKKFSSILTLGELADKIRVLATGAGLNLYKLLPTEPTKLLEICKTLCEHQRLLLFDNYDSEAVNDKWVVHGIHAVLTEIDNCLRAAVVDRSTVEDHHYGIVTEEKLKIILSKSSTANRDVHLALDVLQYFKYCEPVQHGPDHQVRPVQYFFPHLLLLEHDQSGWGDGSFGFAWCIAASEQQDGNIKYFLPRFLKKLQLSLIQKFIPLQSYSQEESRIDGTPSSNKVISVWSRGVSWVDNDQINVNVTMNDGNIILSMQCKRKTNCELNCLKLRNDILTMIREQKGNFQNDIKTEEYLIQCNDDSPLPLHHFNTELQIVPLEEVQTEIMYGGKPDYLDFLLFFEPCTSLAELDQSTQAFLCSNENSSLAINNDMLEEIFTKFGNNRAAVTRHFCLLDPCATPTLSIASTMTASEYEDPTSGQPKLSPLNSQTSTSPTTPKKLLSCLNSISIMNTVEFLQETLTLDKSKLKGEGKQNIQETIETTQNLPVVEPPQTFKCDCAGKKYSIEGHDIAVSIPPDAVAKESSFTISAAVLLSGPFIFHCRQKFVPVSPILHLSVLRGERNRFNKPITISFPHFIDQERIDLQYLALFNAPHVESAASIEFLENKDNQLELNADNRIICETTQGTGFFCIAHKSPEKLKQCTRYYLHKLERTVESSHTIHFYVTYALNTFHRIIKKQFAKFDVKKKEVKLVSNKEAASSEPLVEISYELGQQSNGWEVYNENGEVQITASDIDYWNHNRGTDWYDDLEHATTYPPQFVITADGSSASHTAKLKVNFTGLNKPYRPEIKLTCINQSRTSSVHDLSKSVDVGAILEHHLNILRKCLNVDQVRPLLRQYGVLLPEEAGKLIDLSSQHNTSHSSVVEKLVNMLSSKGASGLYHFMRALEDSTDGTGHQDILKELRENPDFNEIVSKFDTSK